MKLLIENGLAGWKVRFNGRLTRALGRCIESRKTIEYMPKYMDENDWTEVQQTIRHEVAHAIAGHRHGHDATWRAIARRLGVENPSSKSMTANLTRKFTGTCPNCEREVQKDRRNNSSCGKCSDVFDPKFKFIWTRN